ncbi:hypothetical protein [Oceanirhabdus seepicola]|uniref:Uncharacterized protein n=1 Tax=Oceanirhabdus seepicola TaxID=2828781 RepID=A0A9J6NXB2_9CLOT|nr:hypothetical protein [Oceanirhabdus seepicola]MCM1988899.1 hypothetical protein [Oceanirhabdus seepicola]
MENQASISPFRGLRKAVSWYYSFKEMRHKQNAEWRIFISEKCCRLIGGYTKWYYLKRI